MAIDTAAERKNASQIVSGLSGPGVTPDAGQSIAWRIRAAWGYYDSAYAPGLPTSPACSRIIYVLSETRSVIVPSEDRSAIVLSDTKNVTISECSD